MTAQECTPRSNNSHPSPIHPMATAVNMDIAAGTAEATAEVTVVDMGADTVVDMEGAPEAATPTKRTTSA